jgi:DsbC/DsbD-like thiol-disulfide interchange protein
MVSDTTNPATGQVYEKYRAYDGKHYVIGPDGTILAAFSKLGVSLPILMRELAKQGVGSQGPVRWRASAPAGVTRGGRFSVTLSVAIEDGWHIYAITQRAGGPTPLGIALSSGQPFSVAGAIRGPAGVVRFDAGFGMDVAEHEGTADFALPIVVAADAATGPQTVGIAARFQACNASICLPPETAALKIAVTIAQAARHEAGR